MYSAFLFGPNHQRDYRPHQRMRVHAGMLQCASTTTRQLVQRATVRTWDAAERRRLKAEVNALRSRLRDLGFQYSDIGEELSRRYQLRPREAYRLAHGWTLEHAAGRFNARAAAEGADPHGRASMTISRLCEYEKWPHGGRKPSVYTLLILAQIYETCVVRLLDTLDFQNLRPQDRYILAQCAACRLRGQSGGACCD